MKFRSLDVDIRIALTSGHVAIIGSEWCELPLMFHKLAIAQGAEFNKESGKLEKEPAPDNSHSPPVTHDQVIRTAIERMIGREEDGDFTADNNPNTNIVSDLAGMRCRKEDVMRVYREMLAEAAELASEEG